MDAPTIIGVDPGGTTGVVVRRGDELVWHATVASGPWGEQVLEALYRLPPLDCTYDAVAVEEVVAPGGFANGRRAPINLSGLLTTALVAGAVAGWAWTDNLELLWIPPAHNGQGPLDAYPPELRPLRGQGKGADHLRHCRSAYDVAGTAALILRARTPA